MTIQRQYNLPNCTLILEGLGDTIGSAEARPVLSMLVNAECHLVGQEKPLSGGRDFFEGLVSAVSQYAQEILSGVHPARLINPEQWVQFRRVGVNQHRLSVRPPDTTPGSGIAAQFTREIDLTTVQLFDLVEAIDQFFADSQTLPDLALNIKPLSRKYVRSGEPIARQAVPAAIGASSLALAAIALFALPVPKVTQPTCLKMSEPGCTSTPTAGNSPAGSSPSPVAASPSPTPSPSPAASVSPSPSPATAAQPDLTNLESVLNTAPEITDPGQLESLGNQLRSQVDQAWTNRTPFVEDLVYRVGVAKDGAIVGYKPVNPAALTNAKQTPLLDLLYRPATGSPPTNEPIAQFKVAFTSSGVVDVAPWRDAVGSELAPATEITDTQQLEELLPKLREQLIKDWNESSFTAEQDLTFQVRVKPDGAVIDYRPEDQSAVDNAQQTPLPKLAKQVDDSAAPLQESHALFKVVFRAPDGRLELSPWRGWQ
ncbi:DUF4335 domain-containing protein [Leptolyngbya sp. FACHB-36]|uniref:DUF4335 domain-containing protein n=1 Tax=Leptolyngbya sp. FACHB-36 TaxID=2692808 RepID=UPI001680ADB8|nr:DUF4335 domain-containing protein [Leptolyngbya sp. FACHB-36]MBD2021751.1 DUF4335 domain-containing protein [Leptolyngbya sp. FACHB-36]